MVVSLGIAISLWPITLNVNFFRPLKKKLRICRKYWSRVHLCFLIFCATQEHHVRVVNTEMDFFVGPSGNSTTVWEVGTYSLLSKFYHDLYGCLSPTESSLVVNVLEAVKRKLAKSISKKEPVTIDLLQSVYSRLFVDRNIYNQRIICAMLIAFAGFSHSSELLQIRLCDVKFEFTYVKIFLEHSKTDQ